MLFPIFSFLYPLYKEDIFHGNLVIVIITPQIGSWIEVEGQKQKLQRKPAPSRGCKSYHANQRNPRRWDIFVGDSHKWQFVTQTSSILSLLPWLCINVAMTMHYCCHDCAKLLSWLCIVGAMASYTCCHDFAWLLPWLCMIVARIIDNYKVYLTREENLTCLGENCKQICNEWKSLDILINNQSWGLQGVCIESQLTFIDNHQYHCPETET